VKPADLRAWVSEGNTAILFCPFENAFLDDLRIRLNRGAETGTTIMDATPAGASGARRLRFASPSGFTLNDANVPVITLFESEGGPAVVSAEVGSGRIILVADSHPATNTGLADEDNALFLLHAAAPALQGGEVIFDETATRLSMREPGVMAYARKSGLQPLFIELGLLAVLGLWHFSSRTAPPLSQRARTPPAVPDYVTGRARLYEKALMGRSAIRAMTETLRDALHRTSGLSPEASARGDALLERSKRLEKFRIPKPNELVELSRSIHDFMNEVIWKPGRRFRRASRSAPLKPR
jgi:hypothetical protein